MLKFIFLIITGFILTFALQGQVRVIGADDLMVDGVRIRLFGIDSPEFEQSCIDKNGKSYACSVSATNYLTKIVTPQTYCRSKGVDKYDRVLAVCYTGKKDLNAAMVKKGWAVAYDRYSKDYLKEQEFAKKNKLGIWQGQFMKPEDFRIQFYKNKNNRGSFLSK